MLFLQKLSVTCAHTYDTHTHLSRSPPPPNHKQVLQRLDDLDTGMLRVWAVLDGLAAANQAGVAAQAGRPAAAPPSQQVAGLAVTASLAAQAGQPDAVGLAGVAATAAQPVAALPSEQQAAAYVTPPPTADMALPLDVRKRLGGLLADYRSSDFESDLGDDISSMSSPEAEDTDVGLPPGAGANLEVWVWWRHAHSHEHTCTRTHSLTRDPSHAPPPLLIST